MAGLLRQARMLPLLVAATGAAMVVPAAMAFLGGDAPTGRAFLYPAALTVLLALFLVLATAIPEQGPDRGLARGRWMDHPPVLVVLAYLLVPLLMALPLVEAVPGLRFGLAWFEMLSSFTTTGATIFDAPKLIADPVHLWRGLAGWLGGAFVLSVLAVLVGSVAGGGLDPRLDTAAGRNPSAPSGATHARGDARIAACDTKDPILRQVSAVLPAYAMLTAAVWLGLMVAGNSAFLALMQAMAALSTSGIVPGRVPGVAGIGAELVLLIALLPALTRRSLPRAPTAARAVPLASDPELRLAGVLVLTVAGTFVVRHWLGGQLPAGADPLPAAWRALWGGVFTAVSFLTTTGLVSQEWAATRAWSGEGAPGLILLGLAMAGGGLATTAGGLKLLRLHALLLLTRRELERMVHPSSVAGGGAQRRDLRGQGALAAWLFLMLFLLGTIWLIAALTFLGVPLERALVFSVAAITTAGPLVQVAADAPLAWSDLPDAARAVLGLGMVLGRLELLLVLSLLMGRARG